MRTDLTAAFKEKMAEKNRHPITLCEFHFIDEIQYLSDQVIGQDEGLPLEYNPLIESWGNLRDNVRIEPILGAESLEVRQASINVINIGDPPFSQKFKNLNPENVRVFIYQWFAGLAVEDMALIDIFVCQDPIVVSEAQSLCKIELVSPIMAQNPFIWGPNKTIGVRYPMALGKWRTIAKYMNTGPIGFLTYDIDQNFTGELFIDLGSIANYPGSGHIYIDSEQLSYSSYNVNKFVITGRGRNGTTARPHIRGAMVTNPSANYDYSLTAGPVALIENIQGDGENYINPVTIFEGEDPTFLRFAGRPPWHKVEAGAPGEPIQPPDETSDQYGASYETDQYDASVPTSPANINNAGSNVVMNFDDTIGGEKTTNYYGASYETYNTIVGAPTNPANVNNSASNIAQMIINNTVGSEEEETSVYATRINYEINLQQDDAVIDVRDTGNALKATGDATLYHQSTDVNDRLVDGDGFFFGADQWPDLSHLGQFVSVEFVIYAETEGTDSLNNNNDNDWHLEVNGVQESTSTRFWGHTGRTFRETVTSINSWSKLQSAKVGMRVNLGSIEVSSENTFFDFEIRYIRCNVTYIVDPEPTYPVQEIASHFNKNLASLGTLIKAEATIRFNCSNINCTATQRIYQRTNSSAGGTQKWSRAISTTKGMASVTINLNTTSWTTLQATRLALRHEVDSPATPLSNRQVTTQIEYILWEITYQPPFDSTYPQQETVSRFNRDLSSLGALTSVECLVQFDCSAVNHTLAQEIVFRTTSDDADNQVLWSRQISASQGMATQTVYPSLGSMATLQNARVGVRHRTISPAGPGDRRYATTNIRSVLWKITYTPGAIEQPDEERVIYVNELSAEVTALSGANITPARAVQNLLENVGNMAEYIDYDNFDEFHTKYDDAEYYFNGLINGETRLHDALKDLIRQGSTRLAWNAGKVKLVSSFVDSLTPVAPTVEEVEAAKRGEIENTEDLQYFFMDSIRQRAITSQRMRFQDVTNKVNIRYKPDYQLENWLGDYETEDTRSIELVGEQEVSLDYPYVSNDDIISDIGDRILELRGNPRSFDTFRVYMDAFPVEKSDQVYFETKFNDYFGVIGPVLTVQRIFGSGKSRRMNIFEVTIMSTPIVAHPVLIQDTIQVNDSLDNNLIEATYLNIADVINVVDSGPTFHTFIERFINISDTVQVGETLALLKGVEHYLTITDTINVDDSFVPLVTNLVRALRINESVAISEDLMFALETVHRILIEDPIHVRGLIQSFDLFGGYGDGGYGERGYGGPINFYQVYHDQDYVTFSNDDVIHYK